MFYHNIRQELVAWSRHVHSVDCVASKINTTRPKRDEMLTLLGRNKASEMCGTKSSLILSFTGVAIVLKPERRPTSECQAVKEKQQKIKKSINK